jgi:FKBP-type peptidyl-prolyl cis-trans isomerase FkpA
VKKTAAFYIFMSCIFIVTLSSGAFAQNQKSLETDKDKISYTIGNNIAQSLMQIKEEIVLEKVIQGLEDTFHEKPLQLTEEESRRIMQMFSMKMKKKQEQQQKKLVNQALEKGTRFLEENKKKEGVVTTESGLQYLVLKQGNGPKPSKTDRVKVHYKGTTIDGKEFDSSYKRGEPASFSITGVIKGWTEALFLMNVGSKYKLVIPPSLAYGERGAGSSIGPNEVLVFEVELLEIEKDSTGE